MLQNDLHEQAMDLGADFFGVADLSAAHQAVLEQGGPVLAAFPRAVSLGIRLFDPIVNMLPNRSDLAVAMNYKHHCYDLINNRLDHVASRLASVVQSKGYRVVPIPASQTVSDEKLLGAFSHKLAAHLAGHGWIGKSCLLVTPSAGPRVRWASVLTDAPLEPTGASSAPQCASCRECVDICPAHAFTGVGFRPEDPRDVRMVAHRCKAHLDERKEVTGQSVCGLCLYVCPFGRNRGVPD
jgi:epoxyqueuosine reductase QueG